MKHPNDMMQMYILGTLYLSNSSQRNYISSCLDDCSRKQANKWSERKTSVDVLDVTKSSHHDMKIFIITLSSKKEN